MKLSIVRRLAFFAPVVFDSSSGWIPTTPKCLLKKGALTPNRRSLQSLQSIHTNPSEDIVLSKDATTQIDVNVLDEFVDFLQSRQIQIIQQIEDLEAKYSSEKVVFSNDPWGVFDQELSSTVTHDTSLKNGGITRVLQGGAVVEKGACSLTVIRHGRLTAERAEAIQSRPAFSSEDSFLMGENDLYSAAALSIVLHSRHPMVPTFRSDVRLFQVQSCKNNQTVSWFGGGADLTPYYLFDSDIIEFHTCYRDLCAPLHLPDFTYAQLKQACDKYFFLPARQEHRGTGGIFFDDLLVSNETIVFVQNLVDTWMKSWLPIVQKRQTVSFTDQEKQWQLLRRGRYLEFNLLYDRGVKFGLANANPRTEGVMVSAPPLIAFEYNHRIEPGSREDELLRVLKRPRVWVV